MRTATTIKTIRTTCGKTITYMDTGEGVLKIHSTTGPAIVYNNEEASPEYYLYGIRYTKTQWQELLAQHKAAPINDGFRFDM